MQHNNLLWQLFNLQWSTWCQVRKTDVSIATNYDILKDTSLTSDVMHVMNTDILSWTALTEGPLQEHQHHTTRTHRNIHTRWSSRHHWEDWERSDQSRSQSRYNRHHSSSHCDLHRDCSRSQQWDRLSHHRSSSRWPHSAHQGHNGNPCHDTPYQSHQSHCKSSTHCSSSGYHSQDCNRSYSCPSCQSSKYTSHQRGSYSLGSYCNLRTWKSHLKRNMKVQIEEPPSDYYSSDDNSTNSGEESVSLN